MGTSPDFGRDSSFQLNAKSPERALVAFVCFGNACRSPMAEAFLRNHKLDWLEAASAGVFPLGHIPAETIEVMAEKGISLDGQVSKSVDDIDWRQVDILINMSSLALDSVTPAFAGRREAWDVPDPFQKPVESYRETRDLLEKKVDELVLVLKTIRGGGSSAPLSA